MTAYYIRPMLWVLLSLWASASHAQSKDEALDFQRQTIELVDLTLEAAEFAGPADVGLARELEAKTQQWQHRLDSTNTELSRNVAQGSQALSTADKKLARVLNWAKLVQQELKVVAQIKRKTGKAPARNEALFGRSLVVTHAHPASLNCETAFEMALGSVAFDLLPAQPQWVSVVTDLSGSLLLDTVGSNVETKLSIYTSCASANANEAALQSENALGLFAQTTLDRSARPQRYLVKIEADQPGVAQLLVRLAQGQISGTVTIPPGANPNSNQQQVDFYRENQGFLSYQTSATTNLIGSYSRALPAGSYVVHVRGQNIFPSASGERTVGKLFRDVECFELNQSNGQNSLCPWSLAQRVPVSDDNTASDINIALTQGASISGRIFGLLPESRAEIQLSTMGGQNLNPAIADAVGRYRFTGLPAGTFFALAQGDNFSPQIFSGLNCSPSGACNPTSGTPIQIASGARQGDIDFSPLRRPSIIGTLSVSPTANPANRFVEVYRSDGQVVARNSTDSQGQYRVVLDPGSYRIVFVADGHFREVFDDVLCVQANGFQCTNLNEGLLITLTREQVFTANATLRPLPGISGLVRDAAGNTLAGVSVRPCDVSNGSCNFSQVTGESGEYRISGLLPGRYTLFASSSTHIDEVYPNVVCQGPQSAPCRPELANGQVFEITANSIDLPNIDFMLDRGGSITGSVTPNTFFSSASATVFKEGVTSGAYRSVSLFLAPNQQYRIEDLEPGRYRIIYHQSSNFFSQIYPQINCTVCDVSLGTRIDVGLAQDTPNINFKLSALRAISGRALAAGSNNPLASVGIDFWRRNNPPLLPTLVASTLTDADGTYFKPFQFDNFNLLVSTDAVNTYFNQIHSGIACLFDTSAYDGNCGFTGATPLAIPAQFPGALDNINFILQPTAPALTIFANGFEE